VCGIIGATGAGEPFGVIAAGLAALEYRGYDSAGLAVVDAEHGRLFRVRAAERARSLERLELARASAPAAGAAIGHTRWATHGPPTEENAHPHLDCTGRVAIVHNGIIENHRELAAELEARGHARASATDSEVLAHLLEEEIGEGRCLGEALRRAAGRLRGDFAVAAISTSEPDCIVATRSSAPLIVGLTDSLGLVASDVAALLATTRRLYALGDGEVATIRPGSLEVVGPDGAPVVPVPLAVDWDVAAARKGGYPDFMSKEMHEQPLALAETLLGRVGPAGETELEELELREADLASLRRVVFVACGSSFHAGLVARQAVEAWARLPAEADIASEFRYREPVLEPGTLVVAISQSGETADTLHAVREARRRGAAVLALTNVVGSVMAREADGALYTRAGPEVGVASTKCHLAQLALLEAFALHLARVRGALGGERLRSIARALRALPDAVAASLARAADYEAVARRFAGVEDFYFLGRRAGLPVALEGALKLKELAYVRAEAYPAGEMKHGPISLIEPGAVVVVVATRSALWEKLMSNVAEMQARGATVVAVAEEGDAETARRVDAVLEVPAVCELCSPVVDVVPLQFFAYTIARARGNDVDRPRNLAKVVTVE